jgi:hypothetical protein
MYLKNTQQRGLRTQRIIDTNLVEKVNIRVFYACGSLAHLNLNDINLILDGINKP